MQTFIESLNFTSQLFIALFLLNLLAAPILGIASKLVTIWTRDRMYPCWGTLLQVIKYKAWDNKLQEYYQGHIDTKNGKEGFYCRRDSYINSERVRTPWDKTGKEFAANSISEQALFQGWFLKDLLMFGVLTIFLCLLSQHIGIIALYVVSTILSVVFLPRYAFDLAHSIKYNAKTLKAERVEELEARINELEGRG